MVASGMSRWFEMTSDLHTAMSESLCSNCSSISFLQKMNSLYAAHVYQICWTLKSTDIDNKYISVFKQSSTSQFWQCQNRLVQHYFKTNIFQYVILYRPILWLRQRNRFVLRNYSVPLRKQNWLQLKLFTWRLFFNTFSIKIIQLDFKTWIH